MKPSSYEKLPYVLAAAFFPGGLLAGWYVRGFHALGLGMLGTSCVAICVATSILFRSPVVGFAIANLLLFLSFWVVAPPRLPFDETLPRLRAFLRASAGVLLLAWTSVIAISLPEQALPMSVHFLLLVHLTVVLSLVVRPSLLMKS